MTKKSLAGNKKNLNRNQNPTKKLPQVVDKWIIFNDHA